MIRWLPWPRRSERQEAIQAAAAEAARSARAARRARRLADDLRSMAGDEYAQALVEDLVRKGGGA